LVASAFVASSWKVLARRGAARRGQSLTMI
jgi:hypothetical protein